MAKIFTYFVGLMITVDAHAGLFQYFKDENGNTKWQWVANWSSGILLIILSISLITLFFIHRRVRKANRELQIMREVLEERVLERTADLEKTAGQLRSSEAYIRDILEQMPLVLIGVDREFRITRWNRLAEKLVGVSRDAALGSELWSVYPTITLGRQQVQSVFDSRKTVEIKHSQSGRCYYDITLYSLSNSDDSGAIILIHDVTERIMAENRLVQRDRMAAMGEFADAIARDLTQPLQQMLDDVRQLEGSYQGIQTASSDVQLLRDAAEQGQRVRSVIDHFLGFASADKERRNDENVAEIVDHAVDIARELLDEPGKLSFSEVAIVTSYEDNLPKLMCNKLELQQVFLAIFRHALIALAQRDESSAQPEIQIELMECYDAIWMRVHHNGIGLTGMQQQQIFEPFFKDVDNSPELENLARLSLAYYIVCDRHKGQIAVTSDVELGTTFHIQLPLAVRITDENATK